MAAAMETRENTGNDPVLQESGKDRRRMKDIFRKIREQMEFYFSDSNLQKDAYLSNLIKQSEEGYVSLSEFMKFNKVKVLTSRTKEIAQALRQSDLFQISADELSVRRTTPIQTLPNVDERTIYVENIPAHATHNWFRDVFKSFGQVTYISLPKYPTSGLLKGFAFVEFHSVEAAENAVKHYSIPSADQLTNLATENVEAPEEVDRCERQGNKRKLESSEQDGEEVRSKRVKSPDKKVECPTETAVQECAGKMAAKKNRKRKKKHKEKHKDDTSQLTVMSKVVWNRFKKTYQSIQKARMSEVKNSLKSGAPPSDHTSVDEMAAIKPEADQKTPSGDPEFTSGVIIRLNLSQAVAESGVKEVKKKFRALANVQYVDIKEGRPCIYIRCADSDSTQQVLAAVSQDGESVLLKGEEETEYWKQIKADRANTMSSQTRLKIRGSQKILAKVTKSVERGNCHIRFDD